MSVIIVDMLGLYARVCRGHEAGHTGMPFSPLLLVGHCPAKRSERRVTLTFIRDISTKVCDKCSLTLCFCTMFSSLQDCIHLPYYLGSQPKQMWTGHLRIETWRGAFCRLICSSIFFIILIVVVTKQLTSLFIGVAVPKPEMVVASSRVCGRVFYALCFVLFASIVMS